MGSSRQKRNSIAAQNAANAQRDAWKTVAARCAVGVLVLAVAVAKVTQKRRDVDISTITESRHCPRDRIKEYQHRPTFVKAPACPYVVRGFVADAAWLGTAFLKRLERATGLPSIEYDELSRGNVFTYYDRNMQHLPATSSHGRKVATSPRHLLSAIKKSRAARFGGPARAVSPQLESEIDSKAWAAEARTTWDLGDTPRLTGLWLGGKNTSSASHFDLFANFHVLLSGKKSVRLAPPSDHASFNFYPAPHPHARQARVDAAFEAASVLLHEGDAVYMPSGWVHRVGVAGTAPAAAASFTATPPEFHAFEGLVRAHAGAFFADTSRPWSRERESAVKRVFLPAVAYFWLGAAGQTVLQDYARAYDGVARAVPDVECPVPSRADIQLALAHAKAAAAAFQWFRVDLARLFFGPFADTVVQRVPHPALQGAPRWAASAAFVRECCTFKGDSGGFSLRALLEPDIKPD